MCIAGYFLNVSFKSFFNVKCHMYQKRDGNWIWLVLIPLPLTATPLYKILKLLLECRKSVHNKLIPQLSWVNASHSSSLVSLVQKWGRLHDSVALCSNILRCPLPEATVLQSSSSTSCRLGCPSWWSWVSLMMQSSHLKRGLPHTFPQCTYYYMPSLVGGLRPSSPRELII